MRSDEVEGNREYDAAGVRISVVLAVVAFVCFILPALIMVARKDVEQREAGEMLARDAPVLVIDPVTLRKATWPRLMAECLAKEPEYVCVVKVRDAVEASVRLGEMLGNGVGEGR